MPNQKPTYFKNLSGTIISFKSLPQFPITLRINSKVLITEIYKASHFPSPLLSTSNTELLAISWAQQEHTQFRPSHLLIYYSFEMLSLVHDSSKEKSQ